MPVGVGRLCTLEAAKPGHILLLHSVCSTAHLIKSQVLLLIFACRKRKSKNLKHVAGSLAAYFNFITTQETPFGATVYLIFDMFNILKVKVKYTGIEVLILQIAYS